MSDLVEREMSWRRATILLELPPLSLSLSISLNLSLAGIFSESAMILLGMICFDFFHHCTSLYLL